MTRAMVKPDADQAMALGKSSLGTRLGSTACCAGFWKAREMPNRMSSAMISGKLSIPAKVMANRPIAHRVCNEMQKMMMRMRATRSATKPDSRNSAANGANWASPTRPRSSWLPVIR